MTIARTDRPVAIVTGAAQRIGRQIACTLAENGWNIVLHYRGSQQAASETHRDLTAIGGRHSMLQADLCDEDATRALFADSVKALGRVDAVINNAAIFDYDDATTFRTSNMLAHMLPNLGAPLILAQELHRHIVEQGSQSTGVVVNLLDQKLQHPNPDFLSYTLSKSALKAATALIARALAPQIRVVGVSPGLTLPSHLQTDDAFDKTHRLAPLGQASTPIDIAQAVLFLLQSPCITGIDLAVDGGQHLVGMDRDFSLMDV